MEEKPIYTTNPPPQESAESLPLTSHELPANWLTALQQTTAQAMITASGLPQPAREHLQASTYDTPEAVQSAIDRERAYLAPQESSVITLGSIPPRSRNAMHGAVTGLRTSLDQLSEALVLGLRPKNAQPLSGISEFYHLISGDYEMSGVFQPERIQFAKVNSSTYLFRSIFPYPQLCQLCQLSRATPLMFPRQPWHSGITAQWHSWHSPLLLRSST